MNELPTQALNEIGEIANVTAEDGGYTLTIGVPNSSKEGDEAYQEACDDAEQAIMSFLPVGWRFRWSGTGNTDHTGACTEDAYLEYVA